MKNLALKRGDYVIFRLYYKARPGFMDWRECVALCHGHEPGSRTYYQFTLDGQKGVHYASCDSLIRRASVLEVLAAGELSPL